MCICKQCGEALVNDWLTCNDGDFCGHDCANKWRVTQPDPTPMILTCPSCSERHVDEGKFASKVHHTHACQSCGMVWRPAIVPTVGVRFLPGFKNGEE